MMIRGPIGDSHLIAESHCEPNTFIKRYPPDYKTRRQKHLILAFSLSVGPPGIVYFELRPEKSENLILERSIPRY